MQGLIALFVLIVVGLVSATPLDDYVYRSDGYYNWTIASRVYSASARKTVYTINMISQKYMDGNYSNRETWTHQVLYCRPDRPHYSDLSLMAIGGGSDVQGLVDALCTAGFHAAGVAQVPNQPITFARSPAVTEDNLVAYTWRAYLNDSATNPDQLAHFAMAKAVARAMDTIQAINSSITKFVPAGASKRGWATWFIGAVDSRVVGMIPLVIPVLNLDVGIFNTWRSYGEWGYALDPYTNQRIFDWHGLPEYDRLMENEDPLAYNNRYTDIPKLIVDATQDQFFQLDAPKFFWDVLNGPKYLNLLPNADHSLASALPILPVLAASFMHAVAQGSVAFPQISWDLVYSNTTDKYPSVAVHVNKGQGIVSGVTLFKSTTHPGKRDFRYQTCSGGCYSGLTWTAIPLGFNPNQTQFTVEYNLTDLFIADTMQDQTWTGFFIQVQFSLSLPSGQFVPMNLTTEANIFPDFYPFPAYVPNYAAIDRTAPTQAPTEPPPPAPCAAFISQTQTDSWSDGVESFSQWKALVTVGERSVFDLQVAIDPPAGSNLIFVTQQAEQVSGNIYNLNDWRFAIDFEVPARTNFTFYYQLDSASAASVSLNSIDCTPPPKDCTVSVSIAKDNEWDDGTSRSTQYSLKFINVGTAPIESADIEIGLGNSAYSVSSKYNLAAATQTGSVYSANAPLWGLTPGATISATGFTVTTPLSATASTPTVQSTAFYCQYHY